MVILAVRLKKFSFLLWFNFFLLKSNWASGEETKRVLITTQKNILDLSLRDDQWGSNRTNARIVFRSTNSSLLLVGASASSTINQSREVLFAQSMGSVSKVYSTIYSDTEKEKDIANITISDTTLTDIAYDWGAKVLYFVDRLSQSSRIKALNMDKRSHLHFKRYKAEITGVDVTDTKMANIGNMAIDVTKRVLYYTKYEKGPDTKALHEVLYCAIKRIHLPADWGQILCNWEQSEIVFLFKCNRPITKIWLSEKFIYFTNDLTSIRRIPRSTINEMGRKSFTEEYIRLPIKTGEKRSESFPLLLYSFAILDEKKKDVLIASLDFNNNSSALTRCKDLEGDVTCHVIESAILEDGSEIEFHSFGYIMSMSLLSSENQSSKAAVQLTPGNPLVSLSTSSHDVTPRSTLSVSELTTTSDITSSTYLASQSDGGVDEPRGDAEKINPNLLADPTSDITKTLPDFSKKIATDRDQNFPSGNQEHFEFQNQLSGEPQKWLREKKISVSYDDADLSELEAVDGLGTQHLYRKPRSLGLFHISMAAFTALIIVSAVLCFVVGCARDEIRRTGTQEETPSANLAIRDSCTNQNSFHIFRISENERSASLTSRDRVLKFNFTDDNVYSTLRQGPTCAINPNQLSSFGSNSFGTLVANPRFLDLPYLFGSCQLGSEDTLNNPIHIPGLCPGTSSCHLERG